MNDRANILMEYIKYALAQKSKGTQSKKQIVKHLSEHGLSATEIQLVLDAANI